MIGSLINRNLGEERRVCIWNMNEPDAHVLYYPDYMQRVENDYGAVALISPDGQWLYVSGFRSQNIRPDLGDGPCSSPSEETESYVPNHWDNALIS